MIVNTADILSPCVSLSLLLLLRLDVVVTCVCAQTQTRAYPTESVSVMRDHHTHRQQYNNAMLRRAFFGLRYKCPDFDFFDSAARKNSNPLLLPHSKGVALWVTTGGLLRGLQLCALRHFSSGPGMPIPDDSLCFSAFDR